MASTTVGHCPKCGHDNNPQYSFCGMCGTALRAGIKPAHKKAAPEPDAVTLGGYSILGLAQEPVRPETPEAEVPQEEMSQNAARHEHQDEQQNGSRDLNLPPAVFGRIDPPLADPQEHQLLNRNLDYLFEEDEKNRTPRLRLYVALGLLVIAAATLLWQWQRNGYPWENFSPSSTGHNLGTTPGGVAPAASAPVASAYPAIPQNPPAAPHRKPRRSPNPAQF